MRLSLFLVWIVGLLYVNASDVKLQFGYKENCETDDDCFQYQNIVLKCTQEKCEYAEGGSPERFIGEWADIAERFGKSALRRLIDQVETKGMTENEVVIEMETQGLLKVSPSFKNVLSLDSNARNDLMEAARMNLKVIAEKICEETEMYHLLSQNDAGWSALHYAAEGGHTEIVKTLLVKSKELQIQTQLVNLGNEYGRTALMLAAAGGHFPTVEALLETPDIDVNPKTKFDFTALMFAVKSFREGEDLKIVKALIAKGADLTKEINNPKSNGRDACKMAQEVGKKDIVELVCQDDAPVEDANAGDNGQSEE